MASIVEVEDLWFRYPRADWALHEVGMTVDSSSSLGIVGESGSGKSTLVRILCGLERAAQGAARFDGREITDWLSRDPREFRKRNQIVFQSPASSLDPRMRVGRSIAEPIRALERRAVPDDELERLAALVGLGTDLFSRYPHQLSGGQLQRVVLARALSVGPDILYADEPTSALDVSVQAQVLNLLMELRRRLGLTLVMVSHDLAVVARICENIIVMRYGRIVEAGPTIQVLRDPTSAYTRALIDAASAVSLAETS